MSITASWLDAKHQWSLRTFGPGTREKGVVDHLRRELVEIEEDPTDLYEWVDVLILAFDGAARQGYSGAEIISALYSKQLKNERRTWPDWRLMSEDQAITHVKKTETLAEYFERQPSGPPADVSLDEIVDIVRQGRGESDG